MTAQPLPPTPSSSDFEHPLTIDDYAALGEADHGRVELQEGSLVMSPSPTPDHNVAGLALAMALAAQLPAHLEVVPDVDVHYWIVDLDDPVTVLACHLTDEFGYRDSGVVAGRFVSSVPFEVTVDLERLD